MTALIEMRNGITSLRVIQRTPKYQHKMFLSFSRSSRKRRAKNCRSKLEDNVRFYRIDSRSGNYFRLGSGKLETLTGAGRAGKLLESKSEEVRYVFTTSSEQFRFGHRPVPYLWSTELVAALKRSQSTGFRVSPAKVICDGIPVHGFESVIVEGRGGALDALRSEVERWSQTGKLALLHNATYMIESEWDGSDIFTIRETGNTVYCTEKAAAAIRDLSDLKDLRLTSNEDASMP